MNWHHAKDTLLAPLVQAARPGLVTDVDGTISPIVDQPDAAQVTPRSRELLAALHARLALVAVISGRAAGDVRQRVGLPQLVYVGNHGLETWSGDGVTLIPEAAAYRPALETVLETARAAFGQVPGVLLEDKGATLSIHYRQTRDPAAVQARLGAMLREASATNGLRLFEGRMVFEIRPPLDVNKGSAFSQLVTTYRLDAAVYLGDDTTDADALRAARRLREAGTCHAVGLGVVSDQTPDAVRQSADVLADGIQDVESFFSWLLSASSDAST